MSARSWLQMLVASSWNSFVPRARAWVILVSREAPVKMYSEVGSTSERTLPPSLPTPFSSQVNPSLGRFETQWRAVITSVGARSTPEQMTTELAESGCSIMTTAFCASVELVPSMIASLLEPVFSALEPDPLQAERTTRSAKAEPQRRPISSPGRRREAPSGPAFASASASATPWASSRKCSPESCTDTPLRRKVRCICPQPQRVILVVSLRTSSTWAPQDFREP